MHGSKNVNCKSIPQSFAQHLNNENQKESAIIKGLRRREPNHVLLPKGQKVHFKWQQRKRKEITNP